MTAHGSPDRVPLDALLAHRDFVADYRFSRGWNHRAGTGRCSRRPVGV